MGVNRIRHQRWGSLRFNDGLLEPDFDVYSEELDDEDAIDRGLKPEEEAFLRGFRKII